MSATVAGADGTILATITRHQEPDGSVPALGEPLTVIDIAGDVDSDTGPLLHVSLTRTIDSCPRVCCDLSQVVFFGAAGVNAVLAAHRYAAATGRYFSVRGVHGLTGRVFEVTGLDRVLVFEP